MIRILLFCFFLFFNSIFIFSQQGWWTWMHGSNTQSATGNFGTINVASPTNEPPAFYEPCEWTDNQGRFWLYGGLTDVTPPLNNRYNTLWMFDPATNMWTWKHGSSTPSAIGVYGTKGVAAPTNTPGARSYGSATWADNQGNLWLFGGAGKDATTADRVLSDLWKYNIATSQWTWMAGPTIGNTPGVYGTLGVSAPTNNPPPRDEVCATWVDAQGNLWLFGGHDGITNRLYNDVWKYDVTTNEWTWIRGANGIITPNAPGNYGTKGVAAPTNDPPARQVYSKWKDQAGNFWIYGGIIGAGLYNDLWRYNPTTNMWTWIRGANTGNPTPTPGTKCSPNPNDDPPARGESRACWTDSCYNFWLFGGTGAGAAFFNDLWCYNVQNDEWTLASPNTAYSYGAQGTPAASNFPPPRHGSIPFIENNGNLWFFGGQSLGIAPLTGLKNFNDMWRFVIDTNCVDVSCYSTQNPTAGFLGSNLTGCASLTVSFTNTSQNSNSWNWAFGDGNTSTSQNPTNTYTNPGQYTVTLIASDGSQSDTLIMTNYVTVYANAVATFTSSNDTLCIGQNVTFTNSSTNSNSSAWTFGDGNTSTTTSPTHTYGAVGSYTVTLIAQNTNGCNDTTTQNIFVTGANITPGNPLALNCTTSSGTISASSTTPNATYSWTGTGIVSGGTTSSPTVNQAGTYTVIVTDPVSGCTNSATVTVTLNNTPPNVSATGTTLTSCTNTTGTISATSTTSNVTYNWSGTGIVSGGTTNNPTINATGTYTVTVTDPTNGCTSTATATVNSNVPLPTVTATGATIPCTQTTATINASSTTSNVTYNWTGTGIISGGTTQNPTVQAGTYTVTVTDPVTGCSNTTTVTVNSTPGPIAIANSSQIIPLGQSATITASGGGTYNWFPTTNLNTTTGNTVIATPNQTTVYCVEVTDNSGCKDTACVTITVELPCPTNENLQVPNAFSPNADNVNDEFCLMGWDMCLTEFQVIIFDRWGEKVFESIDPNFCWDGKYKNTLMDAQVFVYYIKAKFLNMDKPVIKKGNISLIR